MKLLVNMGNSDIHVTGAESGDEFVFRDKKHFREKTVRIALALTQASNGLRISEDGTVAGRLEVADPETGRPYPIGKIEFPILKQEIGQIEQTLGRKIDVVHLVCTKQGEPLSSQDTDALFDLLSGRYGKQVFPGIRFEVKYIRCDPSDFGKVYDEYYHWLVSSGFETPAVAIAQGTPAMGYALSSVATRYLRGARLFYAAHEGLQIKVKPLHLFAEEEIANALRHFRSLMDQGEYLAAKEMVQHGILAEVPGLEYLLDSLVARSTYRFDDAMRLLAKLQEKNPALWECMMPYTIGLESLGRCSRFDEKGHEQLLYRQPEFPYLLYETLQNVRFQFQRGNYFLSIALMTSFLDIFQIFVIANELGFETLEYVKDSYPKLNEYIGKYVIKDPSLKTKYGKVAENWKENKSDPEKGKLDPKGPALSHVIKWLAAQPKASVLIKEVRALYKKNGNFQNLRTLRNHLPIAHSVQGVDKQEIEGSICEEYGFLGILDQFEGILWDVNPELAKPKSYQMCSEAVCTEMRKELNEVI